MPVGQNAAVTACEFCHCCVDVLLSWRCSAAGDWNNTAADGVNIVSVYRATALACSVLLLPVATRRSLPAVLLPSLARASFRLA
jgi:hypothetical protein